MVDFNKKQFNELSKIFTAKKYGGCCYYPCGGHVFDEVCFDKKYNFEGVVVASEEDINEVIKKKTYDAVRINSDREDKDDKLYLDLDLMTRDPLTKKWNVIGVKLLVTEELFDELTNNCASNSKLKQRKFAGGNYGSISCTD